MKKRWWLLMAAVVILTVSIVICWDALVMLALPQIPLGKALDSALATLEERYQESPLPILLRGYDERGQQTLQVNLSDDGVPMGTLDAGVDLKENRMLLRGVFPEGSKLRGLDLYLDRNVTAVTAETLLGGGYYGITYETFSEDLQSIPLVALLVPDKLKEEWAESVAGLQGKMDRTISLPSIPQIRSEDLHKLPMGLWAMRPKVSAEDGRWKITYQLKEKTAAFLWEQVMGTTASGDIQIMAVFYMQGKSLVQVDLNIAAGAQQATGTVILGDAPRDADLAINVASGEGKSLAIHICPEGERSTIRLGEKQYAYEWSSATKELTLYLPGKEAVTMTLRTAEKGFCVQSDNILTLLENSPISGFDCDMTVSKGASIPTPEFKNLDQWSLEDLMIFLNGVWTVIKPQG